MATEDEQSDYAKRRDSAHYSIHADDNLPRVEGYSWEKLQDRNFTNNNGGFAGTGELLGGSPPHPWRETDEAVVHFGDRAPEVMKTPVAEGKYPLAFITADIDRNVRLADGSVYNAAHDGALGVGARAQIDGALQAAEVPPPTGVGSDPLERYGGTQNAKAEMDALAQNAWKRGSLSGALDDKANGYEGPGIWADLMHGMFLDKFKAMADRAAERLAQPQQGTQATAGVQNAITMGDNGLAEVGTAKPKGLAGMSFGLGQNLFAEESDKATAELDSELFE